MTVHETSSLLASCLTRLRWSPEHLALEINKKCGAGTISKKAPYNWLKGARPRRHLPHVVAEILADRLGEPITVEALWPGSPPTNRVLGRAARIQTVSSVPSLPVAMADLTNVAVAWLVEDEPALPVRLYGDEVPEVAIQMLSARLQQLRKVDEISSTRLAMDWALQDLQLARKLAADHAYDEPTGVQLHRLIAELAQLAGWLAAELGLLRLARSCLLTGLAAARIARDRSLAAYILSGMSYRSIWEGEPEAGLRLIRIARKGTDRDDRGIHQALLATREARVRAALGDRAGCEHAIAEAAELSLDAEPASAKPWVQWVNRAVILADAGRSWLELGCFRRAESYLAHGLALFGDCQPRNRMLHAASLAEARLGRDEIDGAAEAAEEALSLAGVMVSQRARVRLSGLRRQFLRNDPAIARETSRRIAEFLSRDRLLQES
ncbi:hypothetical protein SAMN05428938_8971 [Streptomyces sp. KS_5]|nr:hypothetical protein SAMN05216482_8294 [Streptomyces sp. PAN_FS17]SEE83533.1 hypothetical protein SAMN05428938_8971 [Streptomyces sp. KS_5]